MQPPHASPTAECARAVREEHEGNGGRQCEAGPRGKGTQIAGAHETNGKSDLAAGRTRQELTQPHEICVGFFVKPAAARDELFAEIPDVSNRPTKTGDAQFEERTEDFERRPCLSLSDTERTRGDSYGVQIVHWNAR